MSMRKPLFACAIALTVGTAFAQSPGTSPKLGKPISEADIKAWDGLR